MLLVTSDFVTIKTNFTPVSVQKTAQNGISNHTQKEKKLSCPKVSLASQPHFLPSGSFSGSPQFSHSPNTIVDNDCPTQVCRQSMSFGFRHSGLEPAAAA